MITSNYLERSTPEERRSILDFWGVNCTDSNTRRIIHWINPEASNNRYKKLLARRNAVDVDADKHITEGRLIGRAALNRMSEANVLGRSSNVFNLTVEIEAGRVTTLSEAEEFFTTNGQHLNDRAIISYLKESAYQLVNDKLQHHKIVGASDEEVSKREKSLLANAHIYYDKDPADGGIQITSSQFYSLLEEYAIINEEINEKCRQLASRD